MITSLHIKNYILIEDLTIDLTRNLNVITGETGAGKSILINAVDIAFGAKVSPEVIGKGADKALIELFITTQNHQKKLKTLFEENDMDLDEEIVITREISQTSSRIRVNGTIVNQAFIKELRELFLDIQTQHQTYSFMQPKTHISVLDNYAKKEYGKDLTEYRELYAEYIKVRKELEKAEKSTQMTENQTDFLKFQIKEIEDAEIKDINEEEELKQELTVLENAEKLKELTYGAYWTLNEDETSIIKGLSQIKTNLSKGSRLDSSLEETESMIIDALELIKDASSTLRDYSQSVSNDTERLDKIQERLYLLDKIKHKYGRNLEEVLNNYDKMSKELADMENSTQNVEKLQKQLKIILDKLTEKAKIISAQRKEISKDLSKKTEEELAKLELAKSRFEIRFEETDLSINGIDNVEFYISTNVSQDLAPLAKSASGGELSRVMLAIKTIFAQADEIDTVIFDEIDTGISGKAAQTVAEEIAKLSKYRQIILITHQAIIASKADKHIFVSKKQEDKTLVNIWELDKEERINAIAGMVSGAVTDSAIEFAKSLLLTKH